MNSVVTSPRAPLPPPHYSEIHKPWKSMIISGGISHEYRDVDMKIQRDKQEHEGSKREMIS